MLVVDAGVLADVLAGGTSRAHTARARLRGRHLWAPSLIDIETVSVLRGLVLAGKLEEKVAREAIDDLAAMPMKRVHHEALLHRCWGLRADVTAYDASYVALAEILDTTLITTDARMVTAPGPTCRIELIG